LPSATEILYTLGLGDSVVGVTHECDFPPEARGTSKVVMSTIDPRELSSAEIDRIVSENAKEGKSTYIVEMERLKAARPDLIITQELCEVCAVSGNETANAIEALGYTPQVVSLYPKNLEEILESIVEVGVATGRENKAREVVAALRSRIDAVRAKLEGERDRPRVFALEWLDPPFVAGHWVPEMVNIAGGDNGLARTGESSKRVSWEEVYEFAPQTILVMPCGYDIEDTLREIETVTADPHWQKLPAVKKGHAYLVDANSYFSRPGPRIVDGLEILAHVLHPEIIENSPPANAVLNLRNYLHFQYHLG